MNKVKFIYCYDNQTTLVAFLEKKNHRYGVSTQGVYVRRVHDRGRVGKWRGHGVNGDWGG